MLEVVSFEVLIIHTAGSQDSHKLLMDLVLWKIQPNNLSLHLNIRHSVTLHVTIVVCLTFTAQNSYHSKYSI